MNGDLAETLLKVKTLLSSINELHSKLVGWVKARIHQKFEEGKPLPKPDPEEHRLLAAIDQLKAEARETIEDTLRGELDPEVRERLQGIRDDLAKMHVDLDLTRDPGEIE
jgi:hypothetical protein